MVHRQLCSIYCKCLANLNNCSIKTHFNLISNKFLAESRLRKHQLHLSIFNTRRHVTVLRNYFNSKQQLYHSPSSTSTTNTLSGLHIYIYDIVSCNTLQTQFYMHAVGMQESRRLLKYATTQQSGFRKPATYIYHTSYKSL